MKIKVGDKAPEFTLPSQDGTQVSLSEFRGKKNVVLYFYPKDDTPGCKMQACGFRDKYPIFANARTEIIGISQDSQQSHKQFATKYNLPFTLLCDTTNKVRQLYASDSSFVISDWFANKSAKSPSHCRGRDTH